MRDYLFKNQERAVRKVEKALDEAHKVGLAFYIASGSMIAYDAKRFNSVEAGTGNALKELQNDNIPNLSVFSDVWIDGGDF